MESLDWDNPVIRLGDAMDVWERASDDDAALDEVAAQDWAQADVDDW